MAKKNILYIFTFLMLLTSCTEKNNTKNILYNMDNIKNTPQTKWDKLVNKKIYFAHQSVGYNIIDGLENHLKENPNIELKVVEGNNSILFDESVFAHSKNGQNSNPKSKIDAFYKTMGSGIGNKIDIAGFKFCYIDFNKDTNVKEIFKYYKQKMNEISLNYPNAKIIHFTVPLTTIQSGPKAIIKKILKKNIGVKDNTVRLQFNTLLAKEFGNQPIFDLAKYESTYPDGEREFTIINDKKIYSMIPTYTNDGGHLSKKGKYYISAQFLIFLAEESENTNN